jgi:hypothetical protein
MIPKAESIYCDACQDTQLLVRDFMPASENNDHDCTDLVCGSCGYVIATLHHPTVTGPGSAQLV